METARSTQGQCLWGDARVGSVTDLGGTDDATLHEPEQILLLFEQIETQVSLSAMGRQQVQ